MARPGFVLLLSAVAVTATGCATPQYVDQKVGAVQTQVGAVQSQVGDVAAHQHDQDTQLGQLDKTSREALDRAQAAGKLAEGKFVYSMVMSDDSAHFPVDRSTLSPEEMARLTDFANRLKTDNRNVYLEIQGYTDSTGAAPLNLQLGADRAEAVRRFLSQQGVALNRMNTISYGQDNPVAPNKTRAGRAQNRRVVVVVLE